MIKYMCIKPNAPKTIKRKLNSEVVNTSLLDYNRFIDIQSQLLTKLFLVKVSSHVDSTKLINGGNLTIRW